MDLDSELFDEEEQQQSTFELATNYVSGRTQKFDNIDLVQFYAYYKQASVGPCNTVRPSILQVAARHKWIAWNALRDMSQVDAQRGYIDLLQEVEPNWKNEPKSKGNSWAVHSIEVQPVEEPLPEDSNKSLFDLVKEQNLEAIEKKMKPSDANVKDEHGMALLHWATDRNAVDIIDYLVLGMGANVDLRDAEMQTPLHYAASCGHVEAVGALLAMRAKLDLYDNDGHSCFDVADTEEIFNLLKAEEEQRQAKAKAKK